MKEFRNSLKIKVNKNAASKKEVEFYQDFGKTMNLRHTGLHTQDIDSFAKRYGIKVWQSYLENNKSAAGRVFWVYASERNDITIIGLKPYPTTKKDTYQKVTLSAVNGAEK